MFKIKTVIVLLGVLFVLAMIPFACTAQGTTIHGRQLRDGTVPFAKLDTAGFPFVKINKSTMQGGYFNINSGYLNALYFPSNGVIGVSGQMAFGAGEIQMYSGAGDLSLTATGDVRIKNIITDDPAGGQAAVLMGQIKTGSDSQPYWEVKVGATVYYIPVLTTLP